MKGLLEEFIQVLIHVIGHPNVWSLHAAAFSGVLTLLAKEQIETFGPFLDRFFESTSICLYGSKYSEVKVNGLDCISKLIPRKDCETV
jgi:hypothetical protein